MLMFVWLDRKGTKVMLIHHNLAGWYLPCPSSAGSVCISLVPALRALSVSRLSQLCGLPLNEQRRIIHRHTSRALSVSPSSARSVRRSSTVKWEIFVRISFVFLHVENFCAEKYFCLSLSFASAGSSHSMMTSTTACPPPSRLRVWITYMLQCQAMPPSRATDKNSSSSI